MVTVHSLNNFYVLKDVLVKHHWQDIYKSRSLVAFGDVQFCPEDMDQTGEVLQMYLFLLL